VVIVMEIPVRKNDLLIIIMNNSFQILKFIK